MQLRINHCFCGLVLILLTLIILPDHLMSQSLPENFSFSEDKRRLSLGGVESSGFYDEMLVRSVYLDFYDPGFWEQMKLNYNTPYYVLARLTYDQQTYDSVAVQFKGQTSYTKPEKEESEKLSFDVKLDELIEGQDIEGYNTFNFNNAFQDASFMKEVLYARLSREHMPAVRGNFIRLFLNEEDWGLYTNIQQLNGDFIREWFMNSDGARWRADVPAWYEQEEIALKSTVETPPAPNWGDGTAALNWLGDTISKYQEYYTLKSSGLDNPWDYLVRVCDVLNNVSPDLLYDSLSNYLQIDGTIWFLAHEIVFSDDDSYIHKGKMDYYLYLDEETGLMIPLEFDGNSAMSLRNVEWSPFYNFEEENYPLLNRLLSVPELRQRYLAHVRTILDECYNAEMAGALIDGYSAMISSHVYSDPKIDFPYNRHLRLVGDLRRFIIERKAFIYSDSLINRLSPEILDVKHMVEGVEWAAPHAGQEALVTAMATHDSGIHSVNLYFGTGLTGNFTSVAMNDDGIDSDGAAGDGVFTGILPHVPAGGYVRYYIEAVADNGQKSVTYMPEGAEYDVFIYQVNVAETPLSDLVLNEFLASNNGTIGDENGEFDDWIEIHNLSDKPISLLGYHISDDSGEPAKWTFPDVSVQPSGYLTIWADNDPEQGKLHSNFKLSADGEEIILSDGGGRIVDQFIYGSQESDVSFGRWPNGTGNFRSMIPTYNISNQVIVSEITEDQEEQFQIYPNPASEFIQIDIRGEEPLEVVIYNSIGQKVFTERFKSRLDISKLYPGIYVLRAGRYVSMFQVQ